MTRCAVLLASSLLLPASCFALNGWGGDVNTGDGGPLVESVRADLAAIVKAPEGERGKLIAAFLEKKGPEKIEAVKRFRNPELKALFHELLKNPDWKMKHRALTVLEHYDDGTAALEALDLLTNAEPRIREKAAIYLLKTWDDGNVLFLKQITVAGIYALAAKEENEHVRSALEALSRRIAKKLVPDKVSTEFTRKLEDGLILTPFLDGMDKVKSVAPEYAAKAVPRQGGASASTLPPASRWVFPLLTWGKEEVNGSLQPFANLRQNGTIYHTGQDIGCCFDGAGYYAVADGIVKFVHTGSDMGTLIVVEHNAGDGLECALYMHGGDTVFVKAGDAVKCGQLLGTMGLSYSIENGGHFAHLHFGLYPGPFMATHNYGYSAVSKGLADWHDPSKWLAERVEATRPLVGGVAGEEYGKAHADAKKTNAELAKKIEDAAGEALKRSEARRDAGYPADALARLKKWAASFKGVPGADKLADAAKSWEADASFKKALAGEKEIAALEAGKPDKAAWEALLKKYDGTCLAARLKQKAEGK